MKTAWVRWRRRLSKSWKPDTPEKLAYLRSLERISAALADGPRDFEPTIAVDDLRELTRVLASWDGSKE
jgi:hypothetical protein